MKTRQDFSHSGTDGDETLGTWGQPYISIQNNSCHITISPTWVSGKPSLHSIKGLHFLQQEGDLSSSCGLLSHPETCQSQVYKKRQEWSRESNFKKIIPYLGSHIKMIQVLKHNPVPSEEAY